MGTTTAGWSIDARRKAIHQVLQVLLDAGMDTGTAYRHLAARTTFNLNTVQGWFANGESRQPPAWSVLDILRVEAGLVAPTPLVPGLRLPAAGEEAAPVKRRPKLKAVSR